MSFGFKSGGILVDRDSFKPPKGYRLLTYGEKTVEGDIYAPTVTRIWRKGAHPNVNVRPGLRALYARLDTKGLEEVLWE